MCFTLDVAPPHSRLTLVLVPLPGVAVPGHPRMQLAQDVGPPLGVLYPVRGPAQGAARPERSPAPVALLSRGF